MLVRAAEKSFEQGSRALAENRCREAMACFEAAVEIEKRFQVRQHQARYLSYYGLCLGMTRTRLHEAIRLCREAVGIEQFNPDLRWNLGRVLMAAGRRREAYDTFIRGLSQQPNHAGLKREMRRLGIRRRPVLPFLSRANPINVMLGKMRAAANAVQVPQT